MTDSEWKIVKRYLKELGAYSSFIKNFDAKFVKQQLPKFFYSEDVTLSEYLKYIRQRDTIHYTFFWQGTKEGHYYWKCIEDGLYRLRRIEDIENVLEIVNKSINS